jgi:hypothetical protein
VKTIKVELSKERLDLIASVLEIEARMRLRADGSVWMGRRGGGRRKWTEEFSDELLKLADALREAE